MRIVTLVLFRPKIGAHIYQNFYLFINTQNLVPSTKLQPLQYSWNTFVFCQNFETVTIP